MSKQTTPETKEVLAIIVNATPDFGSAESIQKIGVRKYIENLVMPSQPMARRFIAMSLDRVDWQEINIALYPGD